MLSRLSTKQQADILNTGATLPRLLRGTVQETAISNLMTLVSQLAAYVHPGLPLTPFQWVKELLGEQIFDSVRLFQSFQNDKTDDSDSPSAFLFDLLGCHGDLHNCKKRPSILAFKKNSADGVVIGMIAYTRLSVDSSLQSVDQVKALFRGISSYSQLLPPFRRTLTAGTITNGHRGRSRSLLPAIMGCPSNLHPHSPFQGIVHSVLLLIKHFRLSFLQIASVLTAWDFCAECSYYFLAATVFAIGYFTEEQIVGINIGHNLLTLIRSIYKYEDKLDCANIPKQFNRYTNNANTCFHSKSNFDHMVYLRVFLGQWCYLFHPRLPKEKTKQKSVYTSVLKIFTKPAKKCIVFAVATG